MTTRWKDPETGRIFGANVGGSTARGTIWRAPADEPAPVAVAPLPVSDRQHPPSPPLAPDDDADVARLRLEIRELFRAQKVGDPAAPVQLAAIRDREYGRADGGRLAIKRTLAGVGYGKPD